jgi:hypothetical protein
MGRKEEAMVVVAVVTVVVCGSRMSRCEAKMGRAWYRGGDAC